MASAYKVAIAGKVLAMVDKGELRLDQMVDIAPESYVPSPVIADNLRHPGVVALGRQPHRGDDRPQRQHRHR